MGDLQAMDAEKGEATWFVTINQAEYFWDDMRELLDLRNADVPSVGGRRQSSLCVNDPVTVAEQFFRRLEAFVTCVLKNPEGPLGEVTSYYWRFETQSRGRQE